MLFRSFLHVDDLAEAAVHLMNHYNSAEIINVGVGEDITIKELAEMVKEIVGYTGKLTFNTTKPDGTPRKLLDVSRLQQAGWKAKIDLKSGIKTTYEWFLHNIDKYRN